MKSILHIISFLTLAVLICSCASRKPYYLEENGLKSSFDEHNIDYELYLVGDIGLESNAFGPTALITLLKGQMRSNAQNQSVVFLGSSLDLSGLPDEETAEFDSTSRVMQMCMEVLREKTNQIHFIPGNNEWSNGKNYTIDNLLATEDFLESLAGGQDVFKPSQGCGEPEILTLSKDLILVLMDSQWLVQSDDSNERKKSGCEIDNNLEFIKFMQDIVATNKDKNIVIATHHPLYSNGKIGGNYPIGSHLLPAPVLGTLLTGVKKIMGGPQQFGHPDYESYRSAFLQGIKNCEGCITISGHENSLQYFLENDNHFVVAGSGSKVNYVRKGDGAVFSNMAQGFAKIVHTKDFELWLEMYGLNEQTKKLNLLYRKLMYKKEPIDYEDKTIYKAKNETPLTIKTNASDFYGNKKFLRGNFYREAWSHEVEVPLLWLEDHHGGLVPIQQGGGFQTSSLRLENPEGVQYVLRSIDKDVGKVVPPALRNTFVRNVVQDGVGASHPYGALAIPILADAAGIYHTNPKIVYLPPQKTLGDYNIDFSNRLYLFEERPGGNTSVHEDFDRPEKTVNTIKLLQLLTKGHEHQVDQEFVLKSRLFDLWIGDWDRHEDQWRWAAFEKEGYTLYRPIPRDRDQVFFNNDGLMDYLASRPFFNPQLRRFDHDIDYLPGLIYNARNFDRSFLHQLRKEDFIEAAKTLQMNLTDEVIDEAFRSWPFEIEQMNAEEIKSKLRSRKAKLTEYAATFYDHINKEVTVVGTHSKDIFELKFLPDNQIDLVVYHKEKNRENIIFEKVIRGLITREIRLYGLKKSDLFVLTGENASTTKVRIIGGSGSDRVTNDSKFKKVFVYDRPNGMVVEGAHHSRLKDESGINSYDQKEWQQNRSIHFPMLSFYTDEGLGVSYNFWWKKFGFRSNPYQSNHSLTFSYFPTNLAFVGKYDGYFPNALNHWDVQLEATGMGPAFTQYFYGLGNTYVNYEEDFPNIEAANNARFHIVKGTRLLFNPSIVGQLGKAGSVKISPSFEYIQIKDTDPDTKFYLLPQAGISSVDFEAAAYGGMKVEYAASRMDNESVPNRGFHFKASAQYKVNLGNSTYNHLTLGTELKTYIPFSQSNTVVLAMNVGGAHTFGEAQFFHENYLSGKSRLRGYRINRFGGESIIYHANDLRVQLTEGKGSFPIPIGVFGSFDYGKAWYDQAIDDDTGMQTSFGGGIYLAPLNMVGFRVGYFVGRDDTQITIGGAIAL